MPLDVAVWRTLADVAENDEEKAGFLTNLSTARASVGDTAGALDAIEAAVEIRRRLAAASPARYEPGLAMSLNNLSNRMGEVGDAAGALEAIREAVEIRRRLAVASPARYEPDLAQSLGTLGTHLREARKIPEAKAAFREGVELVRPHAERFPDGPAARTLANLENDLRQLEETGES